MSLGVLLAIFALILVNALYVAAEFAAVSVRRSRIRQKAEEGHPLAIRLLPFVADAHRLDRLVATCQIGITLSSLVLGAYGQRALAPALVPLFEGWGAMEAVAAQSAATVVVLVVLTGAQMILGELVPKSLALQFPTPVALYTILPLEWSARALSWFIALLNGSGHVLLRMFGARHSGHVHIHTPNEIEYLIAESRKGGLLDADEHARLRTALRLGVTRVDEVMVPRTEIHGIREGTDFDEIRRKVAESPYTRIPVYRESLDHVIGYIHVQDVVRRVMDGRSDPEVRPIVAVGESMTLERVLERLRTERQHMALVVDEFGGTAGLLTVTDILGEIMGGVADEFKAPEAMPERLPDGRIRLPGWLRLGVVAELLAADWEGESNTIGGFVMERLGRIPNEGEELFIDGIAIEIEEVSGRTVESLLARPRGSVEVEDD